MEIAVAVTEILRKVVAVNKPTLESAIAYVENAYRKGEIVLCADDIVPDPITGDTALFEQADWLEAQAECLEDAGERCD